MLIMMHLEKRGRMYGESPLLRWETTSEGEPPSNNIVFTEPNRFASQVLPEFAFPTTSFNSLVRKMYRWGFRRAVMIDQTPVSAGSTPKAFCCDKFRQGDFSLLMQMFSTDSRPKKGRAQPGMKTTMVPITEGRSGSSLESRLAVDSWRYKRQKASETAQTSSSSSLVNQQDSLQPKEASSVEIGDSRVAADARPIQRPEAQRSMPLAMGSRPLLPPPGLLPAPAPISLNPSQSRQLQLRSLMSRQSIEESMLQATLQQLRAEAYRHPVNLAPNSMLTVSHPLPGELNIRISSYPFTTTINLPVLPDSYQSLQTGLGNNASFAGASEFGSRQSLLEQAGLLPTPARIAPPRSLLPANPFGATLPSVGPNRSFPPFLSSSAELDPEQLVVLMRARQGG
jgi:HSF-type DNA-binding